MAPAGTAFAFDLASGAWLSHTLFRRSRPISTNVASMTAVAAEARQPPLALVQALGQLSGPLEQLDASAQLQAVEDVSHGLPLHPPPAANRRRQSAARRRPKQC